MIYVRKAIGLTAALTVSTAVLIIVANRIFPTSDGLVGHDYNYFLPYILAGIEWIRLNGWSAVPYFTPDFCGGMPWLANPQSMFYSVPQALSLFAEPATAIKFTAILCATVGGIATYALLLRSFRTSWHAATLGCVLFQLNGFLFFRIAVGHLTYHVFGLVPVLGWCVLRFSESTKENSSHFVVRIICAIVLAGCLLAMMVYGGALNYIIPAVLSIAIIILLHQMGAGWSWTPWMILFGACIWSVPLSAIKLFGAFELALAFPRTALEHQLFTSPITLAYYLLRSLFIPELLPPFTAMGFGGLDLGLHELEFGISVVPAGLIIGALFSHPNQITRICSKNLLILMMLVVIAAIPIIGTMGNDAWGKFLVRIPIINNNTILTRWYSIYIVPLIVLAALSFDRLTSRVSADFSLTVLVLVCSLLFLNRNLTYYTTPRNGFYLYDPAPVTAEIKRMWSGDLPRPITELGPRDELNADGSKMGATLWTLSAYPCYEPLFGYSSEMFPARKLHTGPISDQIDGGYINIVDPRCYFTSTNACVAGDLFRSEDTSDVLAFASHRPLRWQKPVWQRVADVATLASLVFSAITVLVFSAFNTFFFFLHLSDGWRK